MEAPSERTRVKRHPDRAAYDPAVIRRIVDEALFCHVAVVVDGAPRVIPTIHARVGETLYIHGSNASRTLRALKEGAEACIAITLLDGLVLARSAFNHSMNYRSVIVYGQLRQVTEPAEKWEAQRALVEHVVPGRSEDARMPDDRELRKTTIMAIPLCFGYLAARLGAHKPIPKHSNIRRRIADAIVSKVRDAGGVMTKADLASFESEWVDPIMTSYRGYEVHQIPPNSQGFAVLEMLNIAEAWPMHDGSMSRADVIHYHVAAKKLAFEDRIRYLDDPAFGDPKIAMLISKEHAAKRRSHQGYDRAPLGEQGVRGDQALGRSKISGRLTTRVSLM